MWLDMRYIESDTGAPDWTIHEDVLWRNSGTIPQIEILRNNKKIWLQEIYNNLIIIQNPAYSKLRLPDRRTRQLEPIFLDKNGWEHPDMDSMLEANQRIGKQEYPQKLKLCRMNIFSQ